MSFVIGRNNGSGNLLLRQLCASSSVFMKTAGLSCTYEIPPLTLAKTYCIEMKSHQLPVQIARYYSNVPAFTNRLSQRAFHTKATKNSLNSKFGCSLLNNNKTTSLLKVFSENINRSISGSSCSAVHLSNITSAKGSSTAKMKDWESNLDPVQKQLLEEECILLDNKDQVIGHDSKKNCHLVRDNGDVLLHRAFSVFLFNSKGELLLQQRSSTKITFPDMWTNTCCSHPLFTPSEMEEEEATGIKVAARRRLEFELGISPDDIRLEDFQYLTRIHYKALSNSIWGEHEIDYILFLQKDLPIKPNKDEVKEIKFVTLDEIKSMAASNDVQLTPWFELIYKTWLPLWWKNLGNLQPYKDHKKIHKM